MKDICTVSVVTFHPVWGDKANNLKRIKEYIEAAYRKGSNFVIFPEMSLTGYDDEADKPLKEKMQYKLAETIPGPSTEEIAELTKKFGIYVVMGMPARDDKDPDTIYNALAIFSRRASKAPTTRCIFHPRSRTGQPAVTNLSFLIPNSVRSAARSAMTTMHSLSSQDIMSRRAAAC